MKQINLREQVRQALSIEWPAFAESHPRLAAALDQELLIQQTTDQLAEDPEYQRVMRDAEMTGAFAEAAQGVVARLVKDVLSALV